MLVDRRGSFDLFFFEQAKTRLTSCGENGLHYFIHNMKRKEGKEYLLYGNLVGIAVLMRCAGPRCLSSHAVYQILGLSFDSTLGLDDIPDFEVEEKRRGSK